MTELSILIPSRNEPYLLNTVNDLLAHITADTDIIIVLDGDWPIETVPDDPRITLIHHPIPIGQRAAINEAARVSTAKYVLKLDAHCSVAQGFDSVLLSDMQDDWTQVPIMRNLHVFDWICACGERIYQGPEAEACPKCGGTEKTEKEIVWIAKRSPQSKSYCFDPEPHFQYFEEFEKRPECQGPLTETMSLQGSCFMVKRDRFLDLNMCDESLGSWGSQGIEVACKSWLSGGKCIVNHKTWYAHLFRTRGGFSFPYPQSGNQVERAKAGVRELFFENKWERQIRPLSWLVEKFWPVKGWTDEDLKKQKKRDLQKMRQWINESKPQIVKIRELQNSKSTSSKGIVYYTDNRLDPAIMQACQAQLSQSLNGHELISVSLAPLDFGQNITLDLKRGYLAMFKQILTGLEAATADIIFLCEHDVLYHPSHFDFTPPNPHKVYYNTNVWHLRASDGHALYYTAKRLSQLCAYRDVLIEHFRKRVERVEKEGFSYKIGFEPGTHNRPQRIDDLKCGVFVSTYPNVDIKHGKNLTKARWDRAEFRSPKSCPDWQEGDSIPGWGVTKGRFEEFIASL